ncbi:uncharacterized protein LOC134204789 [Armigeres subalbatus]|uniref:uncharacterized protein LOC134204789 n=1 Tax=Armigeres subalbatus TaxID=124917 RepID=UPI002ED25B44
MTCCRQIKCACYSCAVVIIRVKQKIGFIFHPQRIPRTQARASSPTDERFLAVANRPEADDPSLYRSEEARGPLSGRNPPAGPSSYRQSSDPVGKPPSRFTTRFIEKQSPSVACPGSIDPAQRSSTVGPIDTVSLPSFFVRSAASKEGAAEEFVVQS